MPIPRIEPIVIPAVPLPPPPTRGFPPGPTRGIQPPRIREPQLQYPTIELPTTIPGDLGDGEGGSTSPQQPAEEDTRELGDGPSLPPLPDPNTFINIPPPPDPVIEIPYTEIAVPAPDAQVLSTTASAAFVATTSALAATTALKPVMDSLFKILKAAFKQALNKILKKKVKDYSKIKTTDLNLLSLDRFRFDSDRPYQGPQYPGKGQRKGSQGAGKPHPGSTQYTSKHAQDCSLVVLYLFPRAVEQPESSLLLCKVLLLHRPKEC